MRSIKILAILLTGLFLSDVLLTVVSWADDPKPARGSRRGRGEKVGTNEIDKAVKAIKQDGDAVEVIKKDPALDPKEKTAAIKERNENIERTIAENPAPQVYDAGATAAFNQGDNTTGFKRSGQAIELAEEEGDPKPWSAALATRAGAYMKLGDNPRAAADAKRALELDPANKKAHGIYKLTEGRPALAKVPKAGSLDPARAMDAEGTGPQFAGNPQDDGAVGGADTGAASGKVKAEYSASADQIRSRELSESAMKQVGLDPRAALASAKKAIALDPGNAKAHMGAALAALATKDFALAKESAAGAINAAGGSGGMENSAGAQAWLAQAYKARALADEGLGEIELAAEGYRRAYQLDAASDAGELKRLLGRVQGQESAAGSETASGSMPRRPGVSPMILALGGPALLGAGFMIWRRRRLPGPPPASVESARDA